MLSLIIGGSASGKSEYAESLAVSYNTKYLYYIATMQPYGDKETTEKINRHKAMRHKKGFITIECYTQLSSVAVESNSTVLLECIGNLAANEMFSPQGAQKNAANEIISGIKSLLRQCQNLIIVSNDVFADGICYGEGTNEYIKTVADINSFAAQLADNVAEVVCGIPIAIKGEAYAYN
ncbi:MAG TPA: cobalamin biosynthesis protein [Ruminococcaceae bacterium]|nr:cobalamin biosynthesis protein [Oscillospiraceae bacterium]